jgi:hypothetical protein
MPVLTELPDAPANGLTDGEEEASYTCHNSAITHLEPSKVSWCEHTRSQAG